MRTIRVTMKEVVVYEFDIEVEDDFDADDESVENEAEEAFVQMENPPVASIDDRHLAFWEEL